MSHDFTAILKSGKKCYRHLGPEKVSDSLSGASNQQTGLLPWEPQERQEGHHQVDTR